MGYTVAIAFVRVGDDQNPNLTSSGAESQLTAYYEAMIVAFGSVRRWNPDLRLALISNEPPPERYIPLFARLRVEFELVPFGHEPPPGFTDRFMGSLYMLDALAASFDRDSIFIDPDVVCIRELGPDLLDADDRVGVLPMDYSPAHDINGLTRNEAGVLHTLLGEPSSTPIHYGGECYVVPASVAPQVLERVQQAWQFSLIRARSNLSRFTTEEHVLSYAVRGLPTRSVDFAVRRIWTAARLRTVRGDESTLTFWHLPAEKGRGFSNVFEDAIDQSSWFWTSSQSEFTRNVAVAMGIASRDPRRYARDTAAQFLTRAKSRLVR